MKQLLTFLILLVLAVNPLLTRPEYSILQAYGTKCQSCHVNTQGGGLRTLGGWMSRNQTSMIEPSKIGLGSVFDFLQNSNQAMNDIITFGLDGRYQFARWGGPQKTLTINPKTKYEKVNDSIVVKNYLDTTITGPIYDAMIMQLNPYISIKPTEFFELEGFYNFAYDLETQKRYPGQQSYAFSAYLRPGENLPFLRVGYFQPMIGTKWDDHTLLIRQVVGANRATLVLPHDYTEWGAQLEYEAIPWLGATLGVFTNDNLQKIKIVNKDRLSYFFRLGFFPNIDEYLKGWTTFFGGYLMMNSELKTDNGVYFGNDYYTVWNAYFNIGMIDRFSLLTEYMGSKKQEFRTSSNFLVELTYQLFKDIDIGLPFDAAYIYGRYERGNTEFLADKSSYQASQYVLGAKIFPLPYIGVIPEYRIYDRDHVDGHFAAWALQVHLFY